MRVGVAALACALACALVASPAARAATTGATYGNPASVLDAGAGDMASAAYRLRGSVGEPVAGVTSSGSSYTLSSGFVSAVFVPIIRLTPAQLDFGSQAVDAASAAQSIQLTNLGAAPLVVGNVAVDGGFAQTNTCTSALQGGASCTLSVTFKPSATGAASGTLSFTSNAPVSPTRIALTGTGVEAATAPATTTPVIAAPTAPASTSTAAAPLCAPPVPPATTSAPVALSLGVAARDTVAKGATCRYSARVAKGKTYVASLTGIMGAGQLQVFSDAAYTTPVTCLAPDNLANSTFAQPADCSFVAAGAKVYVSVTGTSYQATASNRYDLLVTRRHEAAPANEGTVASPVVITPNKPYGGTVGAGRDDASYYLVNGAGSGDIVISLTGQKADQFLDLFIYDNANFSGIWLGGDNCYTGEHLHAPESCVLPAGKTYYVKVMNRDYVGGPFTLTAETPNP